MLNIDFGKIVTALGEDTIADIGAHEVLEVVLDAVSLVVAEERLGQGRAPARSHELAVIGHGIPPSVGHPYDCTNTYD